MTPEPIKLPEPNEVVPKPKNKFKPLAIVFIILTVLFALVAGFFVWQWLDQKSQIETLKNDISKIQSELESKKDQGNKTDDNWLAIKEWGIKFRIPADMKDDLSYIVGEYGVYFHSKALDNKVGNNDDCSIAAMSRYTIDEYHAVLQEGLPGSPGLLINIVAMDGYYYTATHPNGMCTNDESLWDFAANKTDQFLNLLNPLYTIK